MRYIWMAALTFILAACNYDFVPTPVPEEIHTVVYTNSSSRENVILRITNNDLKVQLTRQNSRGQIISNRYGKTTPNSYNILATRLENANFMQVKSTPARRSSSSQETLVIETQAQTYTFMQNSNTQFPAAIDSIVRSLPGLFPVK